MSTKQPVSITFWSKCAHSPIGPELAQAAQISGKVLPIAPGRGFYAGTLQADQAGVMVLMVKSHRPTRVSVAGRSVAEENLFWRSYQRQMKFAIVMPVAAGQTPLLVEVGDRPWQPEFVDANCPSRNRQRVCDEIKRRHGDEIEIEGWVVPGAAAPAAVLRFTPAQFVRDGAIWQHVYVRTPRELAGPPSRDWSVYTGDVQVKLSTPIGPGAGFEDTPIDDVKAGRRRFFVPVATLDNPIPPLRQGGDEPRRIEPESEQAGELTLTLANDAGAVELPMPVYEYIGRNAPVREFRKLEWPGLDALRAAAPQPILPPQWAHFRELYDYTWDVLLRLVRYPEPYSGLPNSYMCTATENFGTQQFVWDSSFTTMAVAYAWRALNPWAMLDLLYSRQFDGGYIHREHETRDGLPISFEPDFSPNPPIMSIAEWAVFKLTGDRARLAKSLPILAANHDWLRKNRRLDDGTYWTTGLANGLDNSPSLGDGYPCLTAQMAHEAQTLALMAEAVGETAQAATLRAEHADIARACNERLWSESMQIYSTSLAGGGHNPNKVVTAFWPLWAGIVPADRVEALGRHLKDPKSFWRHHPVPSLAADSPQFRPGGDYWRGSTWAPTNFATIKGFDRSGRHDLAVETTVRHLQCMYEVFKDTGRIWENYCSEESKRGSWSGPDYSWTSLGPVAMLLEVLIGIDADASTATLTWNPPSQTNIGVRNFPLGAATVELEQRQAASGAWEIIVKTDRPITLRLMRDGVTREIACKAETAISDL
ncbi:MAG: hypothetical protein LLG01_12225 [Planctomycetaceae bacterium]|nr:hypothetical protein [Planctomycetaceae bacterium]